MVNMAEMVERVDLVTSSSRHLLQGNKIAPTSEQFSPDVYPSLLDTTLYCIHCHIYVHTCADNNTTLHMNVCRQLAQYKM